MNRTILIAAAIASAAAGPAAAHAFLRTARPAVGSIVARPPGEVVIDFTEAVEPLFSTIAVTDRSGARVDRGPVHLEGGGDHLATALAPLRPGRYRVVWHVTAADTHKTQGSFSFTVAP